MVVSIADIPKETNVHRFITSGKPGFCYLRGEKVEKLEKHHLSYDPEITCDLCHNCHHTVHFWPNRLSKEEKLKLLKLRYGLATAQKISEDKFLGIPALAKAIAPSRNKFIRDQQIKEIKRIKKEKKVK